MMGILYSRENDAVEWERAERERRAILAWGRQGGRLQEVVLAYRFARRQGGDAEEAWDCATNAVMVLDPSIAAPANHAAVLIKWMEREHREWFWRCCRHHHEL
jgi:hypothetical protein